MRSRVEAKIAKFMTVLANDKTYYHGSPYATIDSHFKNFKGPVAFFTDNLAVARDYATRPMFGAQTGNHGDKNPTVYTVKIDTGTIFSFRIAKHCDFYDKIRIKYNNEHEDDDDWLPKLTSPGFLQSGSGQPSFGNARTIVKLLEPEFHCMYVDEGTQGLALVVHKPQKFVRVLDKQSV